MVAFSRLSFLIMAPFWCKTLTLNCWKLPFFPNTNSWIFLKIAPNFAKFRTMMIHLYSTECRGSGFTIKNLMYSMATHFYWEKCLGGCEWETQMFFVPGLKQVKWPCYNSIIKLQNCLYLWCVGIDRWRTCMSWGCVVFTMAARGNGCSPYMPIHHTGGSVHYLTKTHTL